MSDKKISNLTNIVQNIDNISGNASESLTNATKLKYFVIRKQSKTKGVDYYWQCKPSVAEKYSVEKFVSLGKNKEQALERWHNLCIKLDTNRQSLKKTGTLPMNYGSNAGDGTLLHMNRLYLGDRRFQRLSDYTKKSYIQVHERFLNSILVTGQVREFRHLKVAKIDRVFCRMLYEKLLLSHGVRSAKHYMDALNNLIKTAIDYGYFKDLNPCLQLTIEKNKPRDQVWTRQEFDDFCNYALKKSYTGLYIAMNIAYHTTQRLTDILNLKWSEVGENFEYIRVCQSKTGARVEIPLYKIKQLKEILLNTLKNKVKTGENSSEYVVVDQTDNMPYHSRFGLFRDRFEAIKTGAKIRKELLFRDLRRTAILALDEAGCTPAEISSISGHSRSSIISMLDVYAPKTKQKAENALDKLNSFRLV